MTNTRRDFLKVAGSAAAASLLRGKNGRAAPPPPPALPVVIATWTHGLPAVATAHSILRKGGDLLDAIEKGINGVEDDPRVMSVGFGGLPNEDGVVQLDAAIMDGRTHRAGAVGALERIRNPISVARKVMERTRHVMLVGDGARKFARKMGFVEQDLSTPESRAAWEKKKDDFWVGGRSAQSARGVGGGHDTVCVLAIDGHGDLASGVSTSGLEWKISGRLGDSPIIGAGSYVDNDVGAAAATGVGELTMRTLASFAIVERMRAGSDPMRACREVMEHVLAKVPEARTDKRTGLCFIALDKRGRYGTVALRGGSSAFPYALAVGAGEAALYQSETLLKE